MAALKETEKTLPGEIKSLPNSDDILKLLECPCCLEPPVPPIKTCAAGHIICSFCRPRLTRCAICREPYTECRNYPLETIFNGCTIACKFWGRGCQQIVSGGKYIDHVKICQYRTLCCSHCQESVSPVDLYVNHLKEQHNAIGYEEENDVYQYTNTIADLYNDIRFPDQFAVFDGKYFIVSAQIRSHFLYIWISVVQDLSVEGDDGTTQDDETILTEIRKKAEESNYTAVITIAPEERSVPEAKWTIPIFPLQNGDPDPSRIVNMPINPTFRGFLTCHADTTSEDEITHKYSWCFQYSISKVMED